MPHPNENNLGGSEEGLPPGASGKVRPKGDGEETGAGTPIDSMFFPYLSEECPSSAVENAPKGEGTSETLYIPGSEASGVPAAHTAGAPTEPESHPTSDGANQADPAGAAEYRSGAKPADSSPSSSSPNHESVTPGGTAGGDRPSQIGKGEETPTATEHGGRGTASHEMEILTHGDPEPGQVFFGRFEVVKRLGSGGQSLVLLVRHLELRGLYALKLLRPNLAFDREARERFQNELRAMLHIGPHPNAVKVHDGNVRADGELLYIVMEHVSGTSLDKLLESGVPMPLDWVDRILRQLCEVLEMMHKRGIVHRDLKPSNLMLVDDRAPGDELLKVLDFGVAKLLATDECPGGDITIRLGKSLAPCTRYYASPEQRTGLEISGSSDIYATGVLLFEMLTGYRPFNGTSHALDLQHISAEVPRFKEVNPDAEVPERIENLVRDCLKKEPQDRPRSPLAFYRDFHAAFLESGFQPQPCDDPEFDPEETPGIEDPKRPKSLDPFTVVVWVAATCLALVSGVWIWRTFG